ncbi:hypothetical protein QE419_000400 [Brevundimonas vesicularis]|uniref:hypothetical protein n=1 Tax=Brevundimonas vesicularis TaxID=41276 RepID=UPI00278237ED|nr:hypothetical protein [Brevundimonas vesicularis]MDQ1191634.1 hypothetical protein [Brevundimonas vesicularis]
MKQHLHSILGGLAGGAILIGLIWLLALPAVVGFADSHNGVAAWVQAVGSVVAIVAAIWIDRGSARRAREATEALRNAEVAAHAERVGEWRRVLDAGFSALEEASNRPGRTDKLSLHPDNVDKDALRRIIENASSMMDIYLSNEPPNPHLGLAVAAMRNELRAMTGTLKSWKRDDVTAHLLAVDFDVHVDAGREILRRYRGE